MTLRLREVGGVSDVERGERCDVAAVHEAVVAKTREAFLPDEEFSRLAETFKVMGDPTRMKIIFALSRDELCVYDLAALLEMSPSAISHQLRVLRNLHLVRSRKEGRHVYYELDDHHILDLFHQGLNHVRHA